IGIKTPEALLARQLASQATGFAIAGRGPMQSDMFPLLEYVAPRAFYIGARARILNLYDERTRQQELAPAGKRAVLQALAKAGARPVFSTFSSINNELQYCLDAETNIVDIPCIFTANSANDSAAGAATNLMFLKLAAKAFAAGNLDRA